jgi:hypothetical protein
MALSSVRDRPEGQPGVGYVPFAKPLANDRYLREAVRSIDGRRIGVAEY